MFWATDKNGYSRTFRGHGPNASQLAAPSSHARRHRPRWKPGRSQRRFAGRARQAEARDPALREVASAVTWAAARPTLSVQLLPGREQGRASHSGQSPGYKPSRSQGPALLTGGRHISHGRDLQPLVRNAHWSRWQPETRKKETPPGAPACSKAQLATARKRRMAASTLIAIC